MCRLVWSLISKELVWPQVDMPLFLNITNKMEVAGVGVFKTPCVVQT